MVLKFKLFKDNVADILTKGLSGQLHDNLAVILETDLEIGYDVGKKVC